MEIRDKRLYRQTHSTFEAYCRERWGWSRQRAYQQIEAASYVSSLSTGVDKPETERQARALIARSLSFPHSRSAIATAQRLFALLRRLAKGVGNNAFDMRGALCRRGQWYAGTGGFRQLVTKSGDPIGYLGGYGGVSGEGYRRGAVGMGAKLRQ